MRLAVIYNPVSDDDPTEVVRRTIDERGLDAMWIETTEGDPGKGQTEEAVEHGCDLVIVVGGDGTVRACAEGAAGTPGVLGIIPAGTGNLLARNLGVPLDPESALSVALEGERCDLDVGTVNDEVFGVIAGAGIDAVIMDQTDRGSKDRLGVLAYVIEGARHVFDAPLAARITIDGGTPISGKWATVMVGNLGRLQGGLDLFPDSSPQDGKIDVLGLSASSPIQNITAAAAVIGNGSDRILRAQASRVTVDFDEPTPYQLDGEPRSATDRLDFSVQSESLSVMIPRREP